MILSNPGTLRQPPSPEMLSTWPAANQRSAASGAVAGAAALIGSRDLIPASDWRGSANDGARIYLTALQSLGLAAATTASLI